MIAEVRELQSQHDDLPGLHQKLLDARAAYQAFLEEIDLEETCLEELKAHAERQHKLAMEAGITGGGKIRKLAEQRPELFDLRRNPPTLLAGD